MICIRPLIILFGFSQDKLKNLLVLSKEISRWPYPLPLAKSRHGKTYQSGCAASQEIHAIFSRKIGQVLSIIKIFRDRIYGAIVVKERIRNHGGRGETPGFHEGSFF